ncbi:MAG: sensor domain-containing diguanylate cyclase [Kofleriaceae bacterium]|nr:sensor domain-containing diguanylate cyclase [Kofleriaceae bacterium]
MGTPESRLRRWLTAIAVSVGLVVTVAAALAFVLVREIQTVNRSVGYELAENLIDANALSVAVFARMAGARGYLLSGDESLLEDRNVARGEAARRLAALRGRRPAPDTADLLDQLEATFVRLDVASERSRDLFATDPAAGVAVWDKETRPIQAQVAILTGQLTAAERASYIAARAAATAASARAAALLRYLLLVVVIVAAILFYAFARLSRALLASQRAEQEQATFRLLEQVPVGIFVTTPDGAPYYVNRHAQALLGRGAERSVRLSDLSRTYQVFQAGTDEPYPTERTPIVRALAGERAEVTDLEIRRGDDVIPLHVVAAPVHGQDGELLYAVAGFQDVREQQRVAMRDTLTGLANRGAAQQAYARERAAAARLGQPLAVAVLDLDQFKAVNDRHGHRAGDDVLRRVAETLVRALRRTDLVGRWGGEELLVLLPGTELAGAARAIEKAAEAVRELTFTGQRGASFGVTFSAGVVLAGPSESLDEVVARADTLLYAAKRAGRDRVLSALPADGGDARA